ncbi:MAG: hypothetical protein WA139_00205 [Candidatus Aenigmatarchaeota archaeon]
MIVKKEERMSMLKKIEDEIGTRYEIEKLQKGLQKTPVVLVKNPNGWEIPSGRLIAYETYVGRVESISPIKKKEYKEPATCGETLGELFALAFGCSRNSYGANFYAPLFEMKYDKPSLEIWNDHEEPPKLSFHEDVDIFEVRAGAEFAFGPAGVRRKLLKDLPPGETLEETEKYLKKMNL